MARTIQDVWNEMDALVASKSKYLFEPIDDEDPFEPFEAVPIKVQCDMAVRVTKSNSEVKKGDIIWIDVNEYCFMDITKIEDDIHE